MRDQETPCLKAGLLSGFSSQFLLDRIRLKLKKLNIVANLYHVPTSNPLWASILSPRLSIYTSTYISKRLVDKAKLPGLGIALEELAGIRERYRKGGKFKRMMASSPFNQLAQSDTNLPQISLRASNIALKALSMLEGLVIEGVRNPLVLESISLVGLGSNF